MDEQEQGYTLTKEAVQRTAKAVRKVLGDGGQLSQPVMGDGEDFVLIKIMSMTVLTDNRHEYTIRLVNKSDKHAIVSVDTADNPIKAYNWYDVAGPVVYVENGTVVPAVLRANDEGEPEYWFSYGMVPKATAKYLVLTAIDDTLKPVWDYIRIQG